MPGRIIYGNQQKNGFQRGQIGVKFGRVEPGVEPQHVADAWYQGSRGAKSIPGGRVLLAEAGSNLSIAVGYESVGPNFGFAAKVSLATDERVDTLSFPRLGAVPDTWEYGFIDRDDKNHRFLVETRDKLRGIYGDHEAVRDLWQITITVWPILEWQWQGTTYSASSSASNNRSTSLPGGIMSGVNVGAAAESKHVRIVKTDWERRQDIAVMVFTTDRETVAAAVENPGHS